MLQEVLNALSVVEMSALKLDSRVGAELTREANATKIIFDAEAVEAGRAFLLALHSITLMATLGVNFLTWRDLSGIHCRLLYHLYHL